MFLHRCISLRNLVAFAGRNPSFLEFFHGWRPSNRHACWSKGQSTLLHQLQPVGLGRIVFGEAIFLNCAALSYKIKADGTFEYILNFGAVFQSLGASIDYRPSIVKVELGMSLKLTWQGIFKCELLVKVEPVLAPITPCTFSRLSMPPIMVGIADSVAAKLHRGDV